jgi:hypothetical protein
MVILLIFVLIVADVKIAVSVGHKMNKLEQIIEMYPDLEFLQADGFDDAVIGVDTKEMRLVYDMEKMVDILAARDEMTFEEALEYLDFNTFCAYVGEKTPLYVQLF